MKSHSTASLTFLPTKPTQRCLSSKPLPSPHHSSHNRSFHPTHKTPLDQLLLASLTTLSSSMASGPLSFGPTLAFNYAPGWYVLHVNTWHSELIVNDTRGHQALSSILSLKHLNHSLLTLSFWIYSPLLLPSLVSSLRSLGVRLATYEGSNRGE